MPHDSILSALVARGVHGTALAWFCSFLSNRNQRARVNISLSEPIAVTSSSIQGSSLGPILFSILLDPLLHQLRTSAFTFADDIKFVIDLFKRSSVVAQKDLDIISMWSTGTKMPISVDKSLVLHGGTNNPRNSYRLAGKILPCESSIRDLGIIRQADGSYSQHITDVITKASRLAGAVSRALRHRPAAIQWLAFNAYILPVLMYASPTWSPSSAGKKKILEKIMRRFTKKLPGLSSQTYSQQLGFLHSMSLENRRLFTDLVYVYKFTHGLLDCAA